MDMVSSIFDGPHLSPNPWVVSYPSNVQLNDEHVLLQEEDISSPTVILSPPNIVYNLHPNMEYD